MHVSARLAACKRPAPALQQRFTSSSQPTLSVRRPAVPVRVRPAQANRPAAASRRARAAHAGPVAHVPPRLLRLLRVRRTSRCAKRRERTALRRQRRFLPIRQRPAKPQRDRAPRCATTPRRPTRWWIVSSSRPAAPARHRTTPPAASRPRPGSQALCSAACASPQCRRAARRRSRPLTSIRRRQAAASTAAGGAISKLQSAPLAASRPRTAAARRGDRARACRAHDKCASPQVSPATLQQHRLVEARRSALPRSQQPAHDRRRRHGTDRQRPGQARDRPSRDGARSRRPAPRPSGAGTPPVRVMTQPGLARPAHQLDRHDAVAAQREEAVIDADPLHPQHPGRQRAQHRLRVACADRAGLPLPRTAPAPAARAGPACRSQSAEAPTARHKPREPDTPANTRPQIGPQHLALQGRSRRAAAPHRRPAASRPAGPPAPSTAALPHPGVARQHRLDLARLNTEAAQLDLPPSARPRNSSTPVRTPPRQVPGPVHPAARNAIRVRDKPLRRQTKPAQIAPRNAKPRDVKLPTNPRRNSLQPTVQYINPRVPNRTANRRYVSPPTAGRS